MHRSASVSFFSGEAHSLEIIRTKLSKFTGGQISCTKNEEKGVAIVCIDHPRKKNAISGKMMIDMENIVNDLKTWQNGKAVLVHGANNIFCSGGDLDFVRQESNSQAGYDISTLMSKVLLEFSNLPLVSVAYLNGHGARGGGAEIAAFCDYRVFSSEPQTCIGFVHNKMGIVPAWGGTSRLVQILGKRKALDVILSGSLLNSTEASELGLADGIVEDYNGALDWTLNKVKGDTSVVRATKASVVNASQITEEMLEVERRILAGLWGGTANKLALGMDIKHK